MPRLLGGGLLTSDVWILLCAASACSHMEHINQCLSSILGSGLQVAGERGGK